MIELYRNGVPEQWLAYKVVMCEKFKSAYYHKIIKTTQHVSARHVYSIDTIVTNLAQSSTIFVA